MITIYYDSEFCNRTKQDVLGYTRVSLTDGHYDILTDFMSDDFKNPIFEVVCYLHNSFPRIKKFSADFVFTWSDRDLINFFGQDLLVGIVNRKHFDKSGKWQGQTSLLYFPDGKLEIKSPKVKGFSHTIKIRLRDIIGLNPSGLKASGEIIDSQFVEGKSLNFDMGNISKHYHEDYEELLTYLKNDVNLTEEVHLNFKNNLENLMREAGHSVKFLDPHYTMGRMSAHAFTSFIYSLHPKMEEAICRHGVFPDYIPLTEEGLNINTKKPVKPKIKGLGVNGKSFYAHRVEGSSWTLGLVYGGRCVNERPYENYAENIADIDLQGCYGTALVSQPYFIGRPKIYFQDNVNRPLTLRQFLNKNEKEFVPYGFQIFISGRLSFDQDLLLSMDINKEKMKRLFNAETEDLAKKVEDSINLFLARNELYHTVITWELLEVLRKVCSSQEMSELLDCEVEAACWFPKSWITNNPQEFVTKSLKGKIYRRKKTNRRGLWSVETGGSKTCLRVMIGDYLKPILDKRMEFKQGGEKSKSDGLKLLINSLYGVFCSRFFDVGHTLVANNITAAGRIGCWQMNKSLDTILSITDGGLFEIDKVRVLKKGRRPSLNILANRSLLNNHRSITITSVKPNEDILLQHIKDFWRIYELPFRFKVELKSHSNQKIFRSVSWINKADYTIFDEGGDSIISKVRGVNPSGLKTNPKIKLLEQLNEEKGGEVDFSKVLEDVETGRFSQEEILSLKKALVSREDNLHLVGFNVEKDFYFRLGLTHLPVKTLKDFRRLKKQDRSWVLIKNAAAPLKM